MTRTTLSDPTTDYATCTSSPTLACPAATTNAQPNWIFKITEYGRLDDGTAMAQSSTATAITTTLAAKCTLLGDEFNPLRETDKMGRANPYQDPNRGRIAALLV